jgi:hypothetical protein
MSSNVPPPSPPRAFVPLAKHGKQPSFPVQTAIPKEVRVLNWRLKKAIPPAGNSARALGGITAL